MDWREKQNKSEKSNHKLPSVEEELAVPTRQVIRKEAHILQRVKSRKSWLRTQFKSIKRLWSTNP